MLFTCPLGDTLCAPFSISASITTSGSSRSSTSHAARPVIRSRSVLGAPALAWLLLSCGSAVAEQSWSIWVDGHEIAGPSTPRRTTACLLVDARALADPLHLSLKVTGADVELRSSDGAVWRAREGALELSSAARVIPLADALTLADGAVLLDVNALARISG